VGFGATINPNIADTVSRVTWDIPLISSGTALYIATGIRQAGTSFYSGGGTGLLISASGQININLIGSMSSPFGLDYFNVATLNVEVFKS